MSLVAGTRLGPYEIQSAIGAGGMGEVYRARDSRLDRTVAVKVLPPDVSGDPDRRTRFEREAKTIAGLNHPHICTLHDVGEYDGSTFLVMELLEGEPLRARLCHARASVPAILETALQLADALECAHAHGVIHRDIKPENIFITTRGAAKLLDFGIVKLVTKETAATAALTATRVGTGPVALGTLAYMSPEQVRGEALDARTDLFSLGVVLYEMATGSAPFHGATSGAVLGEILTKVPVAPVRLNPDVPPDLERIVNKLLEKDRAVRFQTARDLRVDLERLRRTLSERAAAPADQASIVVLPFENLSPDPDNAFFADGLTEEIIADLSKIRALRVISRTSAMHYKGTTKALPAIAQDLNVRHVLEGSVRRAGKSLRITAQLIDATTDTHLWAEKYTGMLDDVFDLQEQLSRRIVEALKGKLTSDDERRLAAHATTDPRAYDVYLRARQEGYRLTREGVERAIRLVGEGKRVLGDSALLHAADAVCHYFAYDFAVSHTEETLARVESSATRALELNPNLALAWFSRGLARYKRGDLPDFVRHLKQSVELERNSDALGYLAFVLAEAGWLAEARRCATETIERDPLTLWAALAPPVVDLFDGQFEAAVARFRDLVTWEGTEAAFTHWWLARALAYSGREDEARATFERAANMGSGLFSEVCELGWRAFSADAAGTRQYFESHELLQQVAMSDETIAGYVATCFARVGAPEAALHWLDQAIRWGFSNHRFLSELNRFLAPLRNDPRFRALMEKAREQQRTFEA